MVPRSDFRTGIEDQSIWPSFPEPIEKEEKKQEERPKEVPKK